MVIKAQGVKKADTVQFNSYSYPGIYCAMADLVLESALKNDFPRAVTLSKILEVMFDRAEHGFHERQPEKWVEIDEAMDAFIRPIILYAGAIPEPAGMKVTHDDFVMKLRQLTRN